VSPPFFFNIRASGFKESPQVLVLDSSHSSHQFSSCVNLLNSLFSHLVKYLRIIFYGLSKNFLTNPLVCSKGLLIKSSHTLDQFPQTSPVNQRTFPEVC
jgi:hypothetical protein